MVDGYAVAVIQIDAPAVFVKGIVIDLGAGDFAGRQAIVAAVANALAGIIVNGVIAYDDAADQGRLTGRPVRGVFTADFDTHHRIVNGIPFDDGVPAAIHIDAAANGIGTEQVTYGVSRNQAVSCLVHPGIRNGRGTVKPGNIDANIGVVMDIVPGNDKAVHIAFNGEGFRIAGCQIVKLVVFHRDVGQRGRRRAFDQHTVDISAGTGCGRAQIVDFVVADFNVFAAVFDINRFEFRSPIVGDFKAAELDAAAGANGYQITAGKAGAADHRHFSRIIDNRKTGFPGNCQFLIVGSGSDINGGTSRRLVDGILNGPIG